MCVCDQQIVDEEKLPHLCAFAITKITGGEEIVFDYGDPDCPWRHVCKFLFLYFQLIFNEVRRKLFFIANKIMLHTQHINIMLVMIFRKPCREISR